MRTVVLALGCAVLFLGAAAENVTEPATGTVFPIALEIKGKPVVCTGVDVRTKYLFKIYAVGHYGAREAWHAESTPEQRLKHWIETPALKAFSLRFTYNVTKDQIRDAWKEGLDQAPYKNGATRESLLSAFKEDLKKGDELRFVAEPDGTLSAEHNGKTLGSWKDAALVKALWAIWMGENSVVKNPANLVKRAAD